LNFADRLVEAVRRSETPLCVGIDPFPERIPALFGDARRHVSVVTDFCTALIEAAGRHCGVVKPQLGLFEPFGPEGVEAARAATQAAQAKGLIVILDAKRGDIGTTAEGYVRASLGPAPGFDADAVTINPYMGLDTIEPFLAYAQAQAKGVAVLVRTSNAGAADVQDLDSGGQPIWARVAGMLAPQADRLKGQSGWSGLMAVAGATAPAQARALRAALPNSLFLVPGYGAQGASAQDSVAGFVAGPHGLEGGIVNSSRAVAYPPAAHGAISLSAWRAAVSEAMEAAAGELRAAVTR